MCVGTSSLYSFMRSYIKLIKNWESFLKNNSDGSLADFGHYLVGLATEDSPARTELDNYFDAKTTEFQYSDLNSEASYLIWRLNKFSKGYIKELFEKLGVANQDEFAILSHVDYLKECPKKIAISDNLIEMSTGIDMIKRLLKKGYLLERKNPEDKRESLIRLSTKGKDKLAEIYTGFSTVPDILVDITPKEKRTLVAILKNLDKAHTMRTQDKEPKLRMKQHRAD